MHKNSCIPFFSLVSIYSNYQVFLLLHPFQDSFQDCSAISWLLQLQKFLLYLLLRRIPIIHIVLLQEHFSGKSRMDLGVALERQDCVFFIHEAFVVLGEINETRRWFAYFTNVELRYSLCFMSVTIFILYSVDDSHKTRFPGEIERSSCLLPSILCLV